MIAALAARRWQLALFVSAYLGLQALLFGLYWGDTPKTLVGDEVSYLAWARGVAGEGPMPAPTGWWPPLQAWLLAGSLRVFGDTLLPIQLLQSVLLLLCAALLRDLWRGCDGRVRAANAAAALFLLNPSTLGYAHWLWPEVPHLFALLLAVWLAARHSGGWAGAAVAGAAAGVAMLAKSLLSAFWPTLALLAARTRRSVLAGLACVAGVLAVTAVPLWQGWQLTGKPLIADSSAFNRVGGLTDRWRSDYVGDSVPLLAGEYFAIDGVRERNAAFARRAEDLIHRQGLVATLSDQLGRQYFRLFNAKTLLVSQLPGPACAGFMGAYHEVGAARVTAVKILAYTSHALMLAAFALGLAVWRRWREPLVWWTALFFAYQLALYLLLHVKARFLLPMVPFMCAFGGSFLAGIGRGDNAICPPGWAHQRLRVVIGLVLGLILLGLAFLGPLLDRSCA
ncbi:glycosyltransferase family 39 protein [Tahibacter amnicola]|uniref:Glycosyltransferase family 39 protein n=1 Tax=Tahibacter amnicola TaxID=2976241 RepID=A0ABY6BDX6_9GAMM|nr:glycosyltransferase family 39 protein [Tahibacter amnicola]UXI67959.1 glycosyltransferase family 39 protein [Tahibacter amnicola]